MTAHCEILGIHELKAGRARKLPRDQENIRHVTAFLGEAKANGSRCAGCGRVSFSTPQRVAIVRIAGRPNPFCSAICPECIDVEAETLAQEAALAIDAGDTSMAVAYVTERRRRSRK